MKANYNLAGTKRKELVHAIEEITGEKADYMRMPTCAYEIGNITVDKDGGVSCSDEEEMQMVMKALNEKGFTAEEDAETKQPEQAETTEPEHTTEEEKETAEDEQEPALTISLPLASANGADDQPSACIRKRRNLEKPDQRKGEPHQEGARNHRHPDQHLG